MGLFSKDSQPSEALREERSEIDILRDKITKANLPENVEAVAHSELERLATTSSNSAEYTIGSNYISYLVGLPWNSYTEDNPDIVEAQTILDNNHFGLNEIKDRILEHLAVRMLKSTRTHRILVVDDERMARQNLEFVLKKEGYNVLSTGSGQEALTMLATKSFDLVITDLKMEEVDGIDVLETAKEKDPTIVVIIVTGYATVPVAVSAMQKGSGHFLSKPLKLDEIRITVKEALKNKNSHWEARGPVLCFVGPPGTGKTSLGRSIAECLNRKFIRISLAGIKDEADIRGHRRSYVGALPGRIIQEINRSGVNNPLILLDEVDKLGQEMKGDPAAALLEVLDPEQNTNFVDHYLDVAFDLSRVMFITTANTTDFIPAALLDRLELLNLSGYTEGEKSRIAQDFLIPKETAEAGLQHEFLSFCPEAVTEIIRSYTFEAGLRELQRQIASLCRKVARVALTEKVDHVSIQPETVSHYLGPPKYQLELAEADDRIGVATGLALTSIGGQIMFIEASIMKGERNLILTGSLGDVMKESAQAALSHLRSNAARYNIDESSFAEHDIHIHVPAGAIPKDGPSAGLTIAAALFSRLTDSPCKRHVAMTGELTLTGRILPVGGMKEKLLAAHRAGITVAIFPEKSRSDLARVPPEIIEKIDIIFINDFSEVIDSAFNQN